MIMALFGTLMSVDYLVYSAFGALIGSAFGGGEFAAYVLLGEFVDAEYRNIYLNLIQLTWGLSIVIMALLYNLKDSWTFLTLVMICFTVFVGTLILSSDESVRFQTSVKKNFSEARRILAKVAALNRSIQFQGTLRGETAD
jgi:hypothetical protein